MLDLGLSVVASEGITASNVQIILISIDVSVELRRGQFRTIKSKLYGIFNFSSSTL